jgi:hypothetical protein
MGWPASQFRGWTGGASPLGRVAGAGRESGAWTAAPRSRRSLGILERCAVPMVLRAPHRGGVAQLVRALPCHGRGRGFESRRSRHCNNVRTPALRIRVGVLFAGGPGCGRSGALAPGACTGRSVSRDHLGDGLVDERTLGDHRIGVDDHQPREDGLVRKPPAGLIELLVDDLASVQKDERVIERLHHVLDLASGSVGPLLGLGALLLDPLLLGLEHLLGDAAVVVELDELLLLRGQLAQASFVAL